MRRFLFTSIALTLLFPVQVSAAELSASELLALPSGELKPVNFSLAVTEDTGDVQTTLKVVGAREGAVSVPDKLWANVDLQSRAADASVHIILEVRVVRGTLYLHVISAEGSGPGIDLAPLHALGPGWVSFPVEAVSPGQWTMPPFDPSRLASAFSVQHTRFGEGEAYQLSLASDAVESLMESVAASLPLVAQAGSLSSDLPLQASVKIDTTHAGEFRFFAGTVSSSALTIDAKVQRQMRPVNVETPRIAPALSDDSLRAILSMLTPTASSCPQTCEGSGQPIVQDSNYDIGSELRYLPENNPASVRRLQRETQRSLIHLYGPDGTDMKLTVRVADIPMSWESLGAFRADFQQGGILSVYPTPRIPSFSTKNAYGPLDVLFFDNRGQFVSAVSMERCQTVLCPETKPSIPVSYALQVPYGFILEHSVGPLWRISIKRYPLTLQVSDGRSLIDRAARRQAREALQAHPPTTRFPLPPTPGYEPILTLATLLSTQVRPADVRAAFRQDVGDWSVHVLYEFLAGAQGSHPELTYLYLVRPTDKPDTFSLVVDSYTFALLSVLDVNSSGRIDPDEQPARVGTRYTYELFTQALLGPVIDTTLGEEVAAYMPVRDEEGNAIAVLAVVERKDGRQSVGVGRPAH